MKRLESGFHASLGLDGRLKDYRASLDATRRFTPTGLDAEASKFVKQEVLPGIVKGTLALAAARRHVKDTWSRLQPKAPDKTDIVSFFKRESIRDELRQLSQNERHNYLTRHAAELDPEILLAAVETVNFPWQDAGQHFITDETRKVLTRRLVAADHADEIAAVEQIEAAIKYAEPTIEQGRIGIQTVLAMNELGWQQALRDEAQKSPPVWLNRAGTAIRVMLVDKRTPFEIPTRPATADEIESGTVFQRFR